MARSVRKFSFLKSWYGVYILTLFGCLPFLLSFIWGNHDWGWVKEGTPLFSGVFEGRFSQFILPILLFSGNILPVFSTALGLAFLSGTAIILLKLWQVPQKHIFYILLGLNITLAPYTISWFYFAFIVLSCLSWTFIVALGFYLPTINYLNKKLAFILSILLFTLALGGYPPSINMIGVIFCTLILKDISSTKPTLKTLILKNIPYAITILGAIFIFLFIQYALKIQHLQYNTYNTANIELSSLPAKILPCLKISLQQFINTTSFIDGFYKYSLLALCLLALTTLYRDIQKNYILIACSVLVILILLIASISTTLAAKNTQYVFFEPRIEFFSLPYIYTFAASILLCSKKQSFRNITLLILTLILFHNIYTMSYAAKIWNFGFKAETNLSERIISRIENHPNFINQDNFYTFVQGDAISIRKKYHLPKPNESVDSFTVTAPYIPWHLPTKTYTFYYPNNFIEKDYDVYWRFVPFYDIPYTAGLEHYINEKAIAWPHQNALYIDSSLIILTMSKNGEIYAKQWLNNYNR